MLADPGARLDLVDALAQAGDLVPRGRCVGQRDLGQQVVVVSAHRERGHLVAGLDGPVQSGSVQPGPVAAGGQRAGQGIEFGQPPVQAALAQFEQLVRLFAGARWVASQLRWRAAVQAAAQASRLASTPAKTSAARGWPVPAKAFWTAALRARVPDTRQRPATVAAGADRRVGQRAEQPPGAQGQGRQAARQAQPAPRRAGPDRGPGLRAARPWTVALGRVRAQAAQHHLAQPGRHAPAGLGRGRAAASAANAPGASSSRRVAGVRPAAPERLVQRHAEAELVGSGPWRTGSRRCSGAM